MCLVRYLNINSFDNLRLDLVILSETNQSHQLSTKLRTFFISLCMQVNFFITGIFYSDCRNVFF